MARNRIEPSRLPTVSGTLAVPIRDTPPPRGSAGGEYPYFLRYRGDTIREGPRHPQGFIRTTPVGSTYGRTLRPLPLSYFVAPEQRTYK